jgi:broad specificity phosphatase PhoE
MKLIILRHGESLDDIEDRYGGYANYDLTAKGVSQAAAVASVLTKFKFNAVNSSPYQRALQTATEVAAAQNQPVIIDTRIRERNTYGYLSGMRKDQAKALFPVDYEKAKDQVLSDEIDGAELMTAVEARLREFMVEINEKTYENVLMVCHGKSIEILLTKVLKVSEKVKFSDCGYLVVDLADGNKIVESENCQISV